MGARCHDGQCRTWGLAAYDATATTPPRYRVWDGSNLSAEVDLPPTSTDVAWVVLRSSPRGNEAVLGALDDDGNLTVHTWNGASWGETWSAALGSIVGGPRSNTRRFDLAFEATTGDALVVFADVTPTFKYRRRTQGRWDEVDQLADVALDDVGLWVRAEPRPGTNDVMVAVLTGASGNALHALRWNGVDEWKSRIETAARPVGSSTPCFDLVAESATGNVMLLWGAAGSTLHSRVFSASWGAETTAYTLPSKALWVTAASDPTPGSRNVAVGVITADAYVERGVWDGTAWLARPAAVPVRAHDVRGVDVAFAGTTGRAVFAYNELATPTQVTTATWTAAEGHGNPVLLPPADGDILFVQLRADWQTNDIMLLSSDTSSGLTQRCWRQGTWSDGTVTADGTVSRVSEPFMFCW
ncbi:MAG: hypothetical protein AB2A00_23695 [Myxococcota bacterium]